PRDTRGDQRRGHPRRTWPRRAPGRRAEEARHGRAIPPSARGAIVGARATATDVGRERRAIRSCGPIGAVVALGLTAVGRTTRGVLTAAKDMHVRHWT